MKPPGGTVVAAWLHPGVVEASFHTCYNRMRAYDTERHRRIIGFIENHCAAGRIIDGRNDVVQTFLDYPDEPDWLWWCDADMGFEPDCVENLVTVADPEERPIVGALCFGQKLLRVGPDGARDFDMFPTIYRLAGEKFAPFYDYPKNTLIRCDGTGSACILIHRSVFEKIRELEGGPYWYHLQPTSDRSAPLGEDLSFCFRALQVGCPVHVHTGIRTSHAKTVYLNEDFYDRDRALPKKSKTFVVIPVKNQAKLTKDLLEQLGEQGGFDEILVFDNGSERKTRNMLESWATNSPSYARLFDAAGVSIHDMWNAGAEYAIDRDPDAHVVFLNNDLRLGPDFIERLTGKFAVDKNILAVSANYDGRQIDGPVQQVFGICAGRYDGTGGLAGFAFAVRGEWFSKGYRFPEWARWWFGDNDLCLSIYEAGGMTVVAGDATVEHLDGGSVTTRTIADEQFVKQIEQDQVEFEKRWDSKTGLRREREFVLE